MKKYILGLLSVLLFSSTYAGYWSFGGGPLDDRIGLGTYQEVIPSRYLNKYDNTHIAYQNTGVVANIGEAHNVFYFIDDGGNFCKRENGEDECYQKSSYAIIAGTMKYISGQLSGYIWVYNYDKTNNRRYVYKYRADDISKSVDRAYLGYANGKPQPIGGVENYVYVTKGSLKKEVVGVRYLETIGNELKVWYYDKNGNIEPSVSGDSLGIGSLEQSYDIDMWSLKLLNRGEGEYEVRYQGKTACSYWGSFEYINRTVHLGNIVGGNNEVYYQDCNHEYPYIYMVVYNNDTGKLEKLKIYSPDGHGIKVDVVDSRNVSLGYHVINITNVTSGSTVIGTYLQLDNYMIYYYDWESNEVKGVFEGDIPEGDIPEGEIDMSGFMDTISGSLTVLNIKIEPEKDRIYCATTGDVEQVCNEKCNGDSVYICEKCAVDGISTKEYVDMLNGCSINTTVTTTIPNNNHLLVRGVGTGLVIYTGGDVIGCEYNKISDDCSLSFTGDLSDNIGELIYYPFCRIKVLGSASAGLFNGMGQLLGVLVGIDNAGYTYNDFIYKGGQGNVATTSQIIMVKFIYYFFRFLDVLVGIFVIYITYSYIKGKSNNE